MLVEQLKGGANEEETTESCKTQRQASEMCKKKKKRESYGNTELTRVGA